MISTNDETPIQEISKRTAEAGAGLAAAAKAVALADHRRMLHDHANRVQDSHECQMRAAGFEPKDRGGEDDEMGDITVTGDIHYQQPPDAKQKTAGGVSDTMKKAALGAALAASGAGLGIGIPWMLGAFDKDAPAVQSTDTRNEYDIEKYIPSRADQ